MTVPFTFRENRSMQKLLPLLIIFSLASCGIAREPLATAPPQNNATYTVEYLFEHEGCKVYRFYDKGNYVYFTNCNGEAIAMTDSTATRNTVKASRKYPSTDGRQQPVKQEE